MKAMKAMKQFILSIRVEKILLKITRFFLYMAYLLYIQTLLSLVSSGYILYTNLIQYEWCNEYAVTNTLDILLIYMVLDTILGIKYYICNDKSILVHHIIFSLLCLTCKYMISKHGFIYELYSIGRWLLLNEISTFFNNIRILSSKSTISNITLYLFAISFIVFRPISVIGSYYELINNKLFIVMAPLVALVSMINTFWCIAIFRKMKKIEKKNYEWRDYTKLSSITLILIPIDLYNHGYYNLYKLQLLFVAISILYHYDIHFMRMLDFMLILILSIIYYTMTKSDTEILLYSCSMILMIFVYIKSYVYEKLHMLLHILLIILHGTFIRFI